MSKKILIVEDNASMRNLISGLLSSEGYHVVGALEDGSHALASVRELKPDIVCLDYLLPGRDGLAILHDINTEFPEIDVLFMTGAEDADIEQKAGDAGASGFLRKPFGQRQVLDELRQVCDIRQQANRSQAIKSPDPERKPSRQSTSGQRPSAIIVDDSSTIRLLLKGVLSELGVTILAQAANGEEAVRSAQTHQPDLVFLDVNMPVMSGLEALPKIRQGSPRTRVVMVTGETSKGLVQQAAALGACGYIVKPVRPAYVEAFLKKLFNR